MLGTGHRSVNMGIVLSDLIGHILAVSLPFNCGDEFTTAWFHVRVMATALVVVV